MKKLLIFTLLLIALTAQGQIKYNLTIQKAAPMLYLNGTSGILRFQGPIDFTQSSGLLTLSGANLGLGTNSLLLTGSIGATGSRVTKIWSVNGEFTNLPTVAGATFKSALSLENVTNESKATMFTSPVFTTDVTLPASISLGGVTITTNGQELNILDGALVNANELNKLVALGPGNIEDRIADLENDPAGVDSNGLLVVGQLQIGSGTNAIRIDSTTNIGQGLTVYQNGTQIGYNNPPEAIVDLRDIALLKHPEINSQTDSYSLLLADDGKIITINKGTATNLTIPLNSAHAFPLGSQVTIVCIGVGKTTIVLTGGVTGISLGNKLGITVKGGATLLKIDTNTWWITGALE